MKTILAAALFLAASTCLAQTEPTLHQTLVFMHSIDSLKIYGSTVEERENRMLSPVVAMTEKAAAALIRLNRNELVRCEVSALKQDYGKNSREVVWSLYSIDLATCVLVK